MMPPSIWPPFYEAKTHAELSLSSVYASGMSERYLGLQDFVPYLPFQAVFSYQIGYQIDVKLKSILFC